MATVTGITVARAQQIENNTVTGGKITGQNLYLTTFGGAQINAGKVVADAVPLVAAWPVGSIFLSTSTSSPATLLGGGVWVRWGQGRVPVSQDTAQDEFNGVEELGGSKAMTVSNMPNHSHGGATQGHSVDHSHTGTAAPVGDHTHPTPYPSTGTAGAGGAGVADDVVGYVFTGASGAHGHSVTTGGASVNHSHAINAEGGGGAANNMPPYIVCYMWKRTS